MVCVYVYRGHLLLLVLRLFSLRENKSSENKVAKKNAARKKHQTHIQKHTQSGNGSNVVVEWDTWCW